MDKEINTKELEKVAKQLLAKGKGIFAADESNSTAGKRLESVGTENSERNRQLYRDLFLNTDGIEDYVSGVIMYDETFWQKTADDEQTFVDLLKEKGILPGIKVDLGAKDFPGFPDEKLTIGLDDLLERAQKYADAGAKFTKWRAVIKIDEEKGLPTAETIEANADALGRYARICQEAGMVPIVEPEALLNGPHSLETAEKVTTEVVTAVFDKLNEYRAHIPGIVLKTSMVINGDANPDEASPEEVADATVSMLREAVPENVGGVVFLSGGQTAVEASAHLDAIAEKEHDEGGFPWEIAFSYARALQGPALKIWQGKSENVDAAREEFKKRLELNSLADAGDYDIELEWAD
jgi:fructose-bisphosphate aldolase class I